VKFEGIALGAGGLREVYRADGRAS